MNPASRSWANFVTLGYYFPEKKLKKNNTSSLTFLLLTHLLQVYLRKSTLVYQSPQKVFIKIIIIIILKKTFKGTDRQKNFMI